MDMECDVSWYDKYASYNYCIDESFLAGHGMQLGLSCELLVTQGIDVLKLSVTQRLIEPIETTNGSIMGIRCTSIDI